MANYTSLDQLLDTTEGMTVLRNNVKNDDGVDTIVGVDWFTFNNIAATTIYASGNSWFGFGESAEHLRVSRRDAAMYYLYRQEGIIGTRRFLKIRWSGYATYSGTTYPLTYEVFLFDTGDIYLNFIVVPSSSSYLGTNQLICNGVTYPYSVTASTPVEYCFYSQDDNGVTWAVAKERYTKYIEYVSSGASVHHILNINSPDNVASSIFWQENTPEGTTVTVSTSLDNDSFVGVVNNGPIVEPGTDVNELWIKVEMTTTDSRVTPSLSNMRLTLQNVNDTYSLVLNMHPRQRFPSAAGDISVAYDAVLGDLAGIGGPVASFTRVFSPQDLVSKPHQNNQERLDISDISAEGIRMRVGYINTKIEDDYIDLGVVAVGILTHINDL